MDRPYDGGHNTSPKLFWKTLGEALGEESDGWHSTRKKRIYVIGIKHGIEFCDQHHTQWPLSQSPSLRDEARRIAANTAKLPRHRLKPSNFHFGIEPVRPAYIFAIQVSSVTVITKNANAIPIFLFVC
jgi:hypothetical protein